MAATDFYLALKSCKGPKIIQVAARHLLRESHGTASVDANRSHLNVVLAGSDDSAGVMKAEQAMRDRAGVAHKRKDAVQLIEVVFSLQPESMVALAQYFRDCLEWVSKQFGTENVLSFVVHHDEGAPHAHALIMPLRGGKLCGSDMLGGRGVMEARNVSFFADVAKKHGLSRPIKMCRADRAALSARVIEALEVVSDPVLSSPHWKAVRKLIEANPMAIARSLQLVPVSRPSKRTFAQIMTGMGRATSEDKSFKGSDSFRTQAVRVVPNVKAIGSHEPPRVLGADKPSKDSQSNPFVCGPSHSEPYPVKGFAISLQLPSPATKAQSTDIRYVRDDDQHGHRDGATADLMPNAPSLSAHASLQCDTSRAQDWEWIDIEGDGSWLDERPEFEPFRPERETCHSRTIVAIISERFITLCHWRCKYWHVISPQYVHHAQLTQRKEPLLISFSVTTR